MATKKEGAKRLLDTLDSSKKLKGGGHDIKSSIIIFLKELCCYQKFFVEGGGGVEKKYVRQGGLLKPYKSVQGGEGGKNR